jgi:class 3 adenylate cyclase
LEEQLPEETQPKNRLKTFLNDGKGKSLGTAEVHGNAGAVVKTKAKQIAELFPDTTVFFCDIVGFTAWSSVREPSHVFTLLETLYSSFDRAARKHRIFKVEVRALYCKFISTVKSLV